MPRIGRYGTRLPDRAKATSSRIVTRFDRTGITLRMLGSAFVLLLLPFGPRLASVDPILLAGVVVMTPFACYGMLRGLTRLGQRHEISVTDEGLSAAWSDAAFLLPFSLQRQAFVAWDDLLEVQASKATLNGSTINRYLHLVTKRGTILVLANELEGAPEDIAQRLRQARPRRRS